MSVYLDVTYVSQLRFGFAGGGDSYGPEGHRDPTGCWYASALMVAYFFEAGPRLGVPSLYRNASPNHPGGHNTLSTADVAILAKNEWLEPVPGAAGALTSEALEALLRSSGPMWFGWKKTISNGVSYGHASVVVGVSGGQVYFHDPEDAPKSQISISKFNAQRYTKLLGDSSMLRRTGSRAAITSKVSPKVRASL